MSNQLNAVADRYTESGLFNSIEWAVAHQGRQIFRGHSSRENNSDALQAHGAPLYRIYSMTKPIVSVGILTLLEENKLRLTDPLSLYIPTASTQQVLDASGKLCQRKSDITIEHLLTHRAGLSYDFIPDCPVATLYREAELAEDGARSLEDLANVLCELPLMAQPGTQWHYSYATDILAHVIEVASGERVDEFLQKRIFDPLGMSDTGYRVTKSEQPRLQTMYGETALGEVGQIETTTQKLVEMDVSRSYPADGGKDFRRGGIGLFSTLDDYLAFSEFLHSGKSADGKIILGDTMVNLMWANRISKDQLPLKIGPNAMSGYGWNLTGRVMLDIGQANFLTGTGEGGWAGAASTWFWVDRIRQLSGVVMTQYLGAIAPLGPDMHAAAYTAFDHLATNRPG